ncbi:hypothetical protein POV27_07415 [Aureisphaera galaxeae]|uniref:hypothetical protein n=1 Tax=Aureisphaera galaxeae TaxID=1538023 RepID=UPI0023506FF2|nr:hypothetical protein [Aureisphaera galaxeae]MDC8003875.1 hypothetical protein [Aureisphaera galaxeae]
MREEEKDKRGFAIIEPPIYEKLDWNMDVIISVLEVIRIRLPELFTEFPESIEYEIIPLGNPFGDPYPVIGLYSDNPKDLESIPDFLDMDERVQNWLKGIEIETLKKESENVKTVSWEVLKNKEY